MADSSQIFLGIMSGSSLDGADLALVRFFSGPDGLTDWQLLATRTVEYDNAFTHKLENAPSLTALALHKLDAEMGTMLGTMCRDFIEETGITPDYIASHGHTVIHAPKHGFTIQIGNPSQIAAHSEVDVIADFRNADIANGGQGAPLAPIVEKLLFTGHGLYLNLGGIANISAHSEKSIKAWDICPCNQLLNFIATKLGKPFDKNGDFAASGEIDIDLLTRLESVISLPVATPYSLDNSFILTSFIPLLRDADCSHEDKMRTSVEYVTNAITTQAIYACKDNAIEPSLYVSGGTAHNAFLISTLRDKLRPSGIEVVVPESTIIDFKEAILMALCGYLRIEGLPNTIASVTGAKCDSINGGIYHA